MVIGRPSIGNVMADRNAIVQKKALIMTLGNTKDLSGLVDLLENEENELIRCDIVTVIGALGNTEAIEILSPFSNNETSIKVKRRIENAIEVLRQFSRY